MKYRLLAFILFCNYFLQAQVQRVSILPQKGIKISKNFGSKIKTISIDYDKNPIFQKNTPNYNQVYTKGNISLTINGLKSARTFQSLVQSENPILIIQPYSLDSARIFLNGNCSEYKTIQSIDIEFIASIEVGNTEKENEAKQAQIIFQNWGYNISQDNFWKKSMVLDILIQNQKITWASENILSENSKKACDILIQKLDLNLFSGQTFKFLISNNYYKLDSNLNLTPESLEKIKNIYFYDLSLSKTQNLHFLNNNDSVSQLSISKKLYYSECQKLTNLNSIEDTIINGQKYVLMLAWKSASFKNYIKPSLIELNCYKSANTFFSYPLFLTTVSDFNNFKQKYNLKSLNEDQLNMRLRQLIGLPPQSQNDNFVEFWVKPEDVFRPTIDSSLNFSRIPYNIDPQYYKLYTEFSKNSFTNSEITKNYPFSGLGYTWDWSPESTDHHGVTEFVLKENREIYVRRVFSTINYLKE